MRGPAMNIQTQPYDYYRLWTPGRMVRLFFLTALLLQPLCTLHAQERPQWHVVAKFNGLKVGDTLIGGSHILWSVDCADSLNCAVVAWVGFAIEPYILMTHNGGRSWQKVYSDTGKNERRYWPLLTEGVAYPVPSLAIVTADSGFILRTSDGGTTWEERRVVETENAVDRGEISMCDSAHGIILWKWPVFDSVGTPDFLMKTEDGGLTWNRLPNSPHPSEWKGVPLWENLPIYSIYCVAPDHYICALSGPSGKIFSVTMDGGETWHHNEDPFGIPYRFNSPSFQFFNRHHGIVGAKEDRVNRAIVARTDDGGLSWKVLYNDSIEGKRGNIYSISFRDSLNGLAAGLGFIFRTTNGGVDWSYDSAEGIQPNSVIPLIVKWVGENRAIAVRRYERILAWDGSPSSVEEKEVETTWLSFTLQPNLLPAGTPSLVEVRAPFPGDLRLELYDPDGKKIMESEELSVEPGLYRLELETGSLASGTYMVRVSNGMESAVQRLVVVR